MTTLAPTIYNRAFPRVSEVIRSLILILLGSWLVALFAQIEIPLPFSPVPITGQTFAVLLVGALLGSKHGSAAVIAYITQGAVGLPFFAGGASGFGILTGATAGYLAGFVVAAYVVGLLAEHGMERNFKTSIVPFLVGTIIIYVFGVAWLSAVVGGVGKAIELGLLPFIVGDVFKMLAAGIALPSAWKMIR